MTSKVFRQLPCEVYTGTYHSRMSLFYGFNCKLKLQVFDVLQHKVIGEMN